MLEIATKLSNKTFFIRLNIIPNAGAGLKHNAMQYINVINNVLMTLIKLFVTSK